MTQVPRSQPVVPNEVRPFGRPFGRVSVAIPIHTPSPSNFAAFHGDPSSRHRAAFFNFVALNFHSHLVYAIGTDQDDITRLIARSRERRGFPIAVEKIERRRSGRSCVKKGTSVVNIARCRSKFSTPKVGPESLRTPHEIQIRGPFRASFELKSAPFLVETASSHATTL